MKNASQRYIIRLLATDHDLFNKRIQNVNAYRDMNTKATGQISSLIDNFLEESELVKT
jgi:hypothetical protein